MNNMNVFKEDKKMEERKEEEKVKDTPFTEDDIEQLAKDVDTVFGDIVRKKMDILQEHHHWTDEEMSKKDIPWDIDVSYCKQQWGGWSLREAEDKMNMLADFMGISVADLAKLYSEVVDDDYTNYDKIYSYIGESKLSMPEYVSSFVNKLIGDGFIEDSCYEYGEPGYRKENDDNMIITANWNEMPLGVLSIIEENGFDIEWSDEWVCDNDNEKIYRSQPDSYSWEPSYFIVDGEVHGISDNEELYLSTMINEPHRLVSASVDLIKYGFVDIEEACRETGMYGTYEDPKDVFDKFKDEYAEMVVQTCSIGQFAINWKVWGRNEDD